MREGGGLLHASKEKKTKKSAGSVRVRMYRVGLGDCFLLTFPNKKKQFHMLVDCGVFFQTPNEKQRMRDIVADIKSATGGTITAEGVYPAGSVDGLHVVRAEFGSHQAVAGVRITSLEDKDGGGGVEPVDPKPGKRTIRWRGTVPPQKWTDFYMKVLTRFAGNPDPNLEVSFEVRVDENEAKSKTDDTKTGLKELGLDDNVSQS